MPVFIVGTRNNFSRPVASISDQAQLLRRSSGLCGDQVNRGAYATTCPLMESRALDLQVPSTGAFRTEDVYPPLPSSSACGTKTYTPPPPQFILPPLIISQGMPPACSRDSARPLRDLPRPRCPPPSPRASAATPSPALTRSNMEQRA